MENYYINLCVVLDYFFCAYDLCVWFQVEFTIKQMSGRVGVIFGGFLDVLIH